MSTCFPKPRFEYVIQSSIRHDRNDNKENGVLIIYKEFNINNYHQMQRFPFAVLILLVLFFIMRRQQNEPLLVDPNDEIRENIVYYDEEGAGM